MNTVLTLVVVIQVLSALAIIGLVLVQHGKGADMGASFGSGASGSLFGASGSSNFLSKLTAFSAVVFFCATLALAMFGGRHAANSGVMDNFSQAPATSSEIPAPPSNTAQPAPADAANAVKPAESSTQIPK